MAKGARLDRWDEAVPYGQRARAREGRCRAAGEQGAMTWNH